MILNTNLGSNKFQGGPSHNQEDFDNQDFEEDDQYLEEDYEDQYADMMLESGQGPNESDAY